MYSNEQQKILPFMIMSFCLGFGSLFGFIVFWQQESYTITEPSYKPIVSDWWIENTEKWAPSINSGSEATIKLTTTTRWWISKENWWIKETSETSIQPLLSWTIWHRWFAKDSIVQQYVQYSYKLGWMRQVLLQECENWRRDITAKWDYWKSYWLCQMHQWYHSIPAEYFTSWQTQVEYCNQKIEWWTKFYWPSRIIKWVRCSEYVKDRFYFE